MTDVKPDATRLPAIYLGHGAPPLLEDAEWMAQGGECLTGAVKRSGVSWDWFVHVLTAGGRTDILRRLRASDLVDA